jgi:hypothetical protein
MTTPKNTFLFVLIAKGEWRRREVRGNKICYET